MRFPRRRLLILAAVAIVAVAGLAYGLRGGGESSIEYRFGAIDRGDVVNAIATSGTLGAVVTVDVGTQVSGQVAELNADFNTEVKEGQLIARIDPQTFESRLRQAEADLAIAKANVSMQTAALTRAEADLASARANLENRRATDDEAQRELKRKEELLGRGVASNRDVTQARALAVSAAAQTRATAAALLSAEAQVRVAQAQIENARAQVQQREASLEQAMIDLERTFIRAPVNGVVINRQVSLGQTVAASLNAPVLFTIAQDLRQMQVEANIDEADIGQVRAGQEVDFTVDAHADRTFRGRIEQVRQAPQVVQNVVTYTVIVSANNAQQLLLPGMTANVNVVLDRRADVLRVPNAALRFRPPNAARDGESGGAPTARQAASGATPGGGGGPGGAGGNPAEQFAQLIETLSLTPAQQEQAQQFGQELRARMQSVRTQGGGREEFVQAAREGRQRFNEQLVAILDETQRTRYAELTAQRRSAGTNAVRQGRIWVLGADGIPKAVPIRYGITNGSLTEIVEGEIAAGDRVIISAIAPEQSAGLTGIRF
ncbi:MAG: efflux RND transporter periplasmic adaptor subunit [Proteobacteria bacterium]|nr:efflux RND transporter periplasmic adaptor subunit [Pseudomonadota bacterium]MDA1059827.1 efflux RND transporter periplasmic adaptor subunit [Pseudomonadota bacterium]